MAVFFIKRCFFLVFAVLFAGCTLSAVSTQSWLESRPSLGNGGLTNTSPTNSFPTNITPTNAVPTNITPTNTVPTNSTPASFFVEVWVKGSSATGYFWQPSAGAYANGVIFQIMHLDRVFAEYESLWWKGDGSHQLYGFSTSDGKSFDIKRYVSSPDLKTPENSNRLHLYYWISKKAFLFGRGDLYITVPVDQFNPDIHQNTALFTLTAYPDLDDPRPDLLVFDGFKLK